MRRRLVFLAVFAVLAIAGLAARAADPLEAFLRHWEDPRQFDARDLAPGFRSEIRDGAKRQTFDRDQTITLAARVKGVLADYRLVSLDILERRPSGGTIRVVYLARAQMNANGGFYDVAYRTSGTLRPGGPNGFVWLEQTNEQIPIPPRS